MKRLLLIIAFAIAVSACTNDPQAMCERSGGTWETFPDACADKCIEARVGNGQQDTQVDDGIFCAQVLTDSCNCGEGRCWNGRTCVAVQE